MAFWTCSKFWGESRKVKKKKYSDYQLSDYAAPHQLSKKNLKLQYVMIQWRFSPNYKISKHHLHCMLNKIICLKSAIFAVKPTADGDYRHPIVIPAHIKHSRIHNINIHRLRLLDYQGSNWLTSCLYKMNGRQVIISAMLCLVSLLHLLQNASS